MSSLIIGLLVLSGCGKNNYVSNVAGSSNQLLASSQNFGSVYTSLKNKITCPSGYRLANDISYTLNGSALSQSTLSGSFSQGALTNGSVSELYVGMSSFRDLMFVSKITNNGSVVGYTVTLSYCSSGSSYNGIPPVISNERSLSNFQSSNIVLNSNTSCGYGLIAYANTYIVSNAIPNNYYTYPTPVQTLFTNQGCF